MNYGLIVENTQKKIDELENRYTLLILVFLGNNDSGRTHQAGHSWLFDQNRISVEWLTPIAVKGLSLVRNIILFPDDSATAQNIEGNNMDYSPID